MKSKARHEIEKWVKTALKNPVYLADGHVFMVPSSEGGMYLVTRLARTLPNGRVVIEWACSCPSFWYSRNDECKHIVLIRTQYEDAKRDRIKEAVK